MSKPPDKDDEKSHQGVEERSSLYCIGTLIYVTFVQNPKVIQKFIYLDNWHEIKTVNNLLKVSSIQIIVPQFTNNLDK